MDRSLARALWHAIEPIHALVYFERSAKDTFEAIGLKGWWMGYFASRGAPLGPVPAEVIVATFYNFAPPMVAKRIPDAWRLASIPEILAARLKVADEGLRRALGDDVSSPEVAAAAELARRAADACRPDGRPLFAAHASLEWPSEPHLSLWHATTLLREHRGDGHVAALVAHEVSGLEANVLISASGAMPADYQQLNRGWSPDQWAEAADRLQTRGLLDADGTLTTAGTELRAAIEDLTDRLAAQPYEQLDPADVEELRRIASGLAARVDAAGGVVYPNPMGLPARN